MPRTLKNTRIKGLPAKVQLRERDRESSYSSTSVYDDTQTLLFKSYPGNLSLPSGLPANSSFLTDELSTDIVVSGVLRKGVGDEFVSLSHEEPYRPFRDSENPAVDGLSARASFFATGSKVADIGEGFDQPVWSKSKFEVDITPSVTHSFFIENYTSASTNFPMAYWNKDRKVWEGIGAGTQFGAYTAGDEGAFRNFCEGQCLGFGNGYNQGTVGNAEFSAGAKISNFSFPFHTKYHATSSNTIAMSDYIKVPFLVEKIVLEWSGSFKFNNTRYASSTNYTVCSFFILNQRKPFAYSDPSYQTFVYRGPDNTTHNLVLSAAIPSIYNSQPAYNTVRDLVTYAQVVGIGGGGNNPSTLARISRELTLVNTTLLSGSQGEWRGRLVMSATIKSPMPNDGLNQIRIGANDGGASSMMTINKNGTRSGLFFPTGRDFVGPFAKGRVLEETDVLTSLGNPTGKIIVLDKYSKTNPYLLQPTDQLIFGWQVPISDEVNSPFGIPHYNTKGPELSFAPTPSKITFYGSMVREAKEVHETSDQVLTSMAVHEVIG